MQTDDYSALEFARALLGGEPSEPSNEFAAVAQVLMGDADAAWEAFLEGKHSHSVKREVVRATFVAIEGLLWQLKQHILRDPMKVAQLSIHEQAALREESYTVDERGIVRSQPRFLPIGSSIRLVTRILHKFQPEFTIDFATAQWQQMQNVIQLRNRLAHPKQSTDLDVKDTDVLVCRGAFLWFGVFTLFVLEIHKASWAVIEAHLLKNPPMPTFFRLAKTEATKPREG